MTGYIRKFEGNRTMSFKISNKQLLKKYNQIWKRVEKLSKIEFDSEPVYGDNDRHIKIKIYNNSTIANFERKKMSKEKAPCKGLSIIMLDSVIKAKKVLSSNNYGRMQTWTKKIKMEDLVNDDLEKRSSDKSGSESDNDAKKSLKSLKAKKVF